jgi:hypothetical protein
MHLDSQDLIEIRIWIKGWKSLSESSRSGEEQRERVIGNQGSLTREEGRSVALVRRRIATGEGGVAGGQELTPETERGSGQRGNRAWPRAQAGKRFFKNRLWAHRTVYSACPVHTGQRTVAVRWTTEHRTGEGVLARARPVHRTVHSAVFGAHRTVRWPQTEGSFENFEFFYLVFNQTKSQLIITQTNTCWDRYWHPHIFSHNFQIFCHRLDSF